jgi:hypothetical protein
VNGILTASLKYFGEPGPTPITNSFFGNYSHWHNQKRVINSSVVYNDLQIMGSNNGFLLVMLIRIFFNVVIDLYFHSPVYPLFAVYSVFSLA